MIMNNCTKMHIKSSILFKVNSELFKFWEIRAALTISSNPTYKTSQYPLFSILNYISEIRSIFPNKIF
jgi:hypothetical protein